MKYRNAHFHNCAVIGPQNRHKNKRNLSLERVQGVTNLKNHISETIWSTEIKFTWPYELDQSFYEYNFIKIYDLNWKNLFFLGDLVWNDPAAETPLFS